jgi:hypothetical protein
MAYIDYPINCILRCSRRHLDYPLAAFVSLPNFRIRGTSWIQQNHTYVIRHGPIERLGCRFRDRSSLPSCFPFRVQMGWRPLCALVDGIFVSTLVLNCIISV